MDAISVWSVRARLNGVIRCVINLNDDGHAGLSRS
jgi:hypothetical protein